MRRGREFANWTGLALAAGLLMARPAAAQDVAESANVPVPKLAGTDKPLSADPEPLEPGSPPPSAADLDPATKGPATPVEEIPTPAGRPNKPMEPASPPPATEPPETPSQDAPAAKPAPVEAAPSTPQPAYVSPEKARTTREPSAPTTPAMDVTPAETVEAAAAIADAKLCEDELKKRGAEFSVSETIADGDCGVLRPVSITKLSSGIAVEPGTQMLCRTALALDIWASEGILPATRTELGNRKPTILRQASTYVCRKRASESGISEHARGSAIDIAGFEFSGGAPITVEKQEPGSAEDRFLADIRRAACGPFKTVLGPGTDSDHGTHLHLDLAARSNGSLYCR